MRVNLPTTDSERHLRDGDSVVSRTDTRGVITYANTTFCEISGYSSEELIGQPHNIMRHPDMPPAVFANLWTTLKAGEAWKGLIKNRCKDGGFYWVEANANPIVADGEVVGYMSLRTRPGIDQTRHAQQAYADMRDASSSKRWRLRRGRCVRTGWAGAIDRLRYPRIRERIAVIIIALALPGLLAGWSALAGMASSNETMAQMHRAHLVPSQQLGMIIRKMMENRILVMQALAHPTPESVAEYKRQIIGAQSEIGTLIDAYRASIEASDQQQLVDSWNDSRLRYKAGIDSVINMLATGDNDGAATVAYTDLPLLYQPLLTNASAMLQRHRDADTAEFHHAQTSYARHMAFAIALILISAAMAAWLGFALFRAITRPLRDARALASAIGSGDLSAAVIDRNDDEIGDIVQAILNISGNLRGLTRDAVIASDTTTDAAFRIADDARDIGLHMVEQKQAVARIADQIRELRQAVAAQLDHAVVAHEIVGDNVKLTTSNRMALQQVIQSIDTVQQATNRIGDIVAVMASIASETDLIALNAAENARSSDPRRALELVVDEVRSLAKRSRTASSGARHMMSEIMNTLDRSAASLATCRERLDVIGEHANEVAHLMESNIENAHTHADSATRVDAELLKLTLLSEDGADLSSQTMERAVMLRKSAEQLLERMSFFTLPVNESSTKVSSSNTRALQTADGAAER